MTFENLSKLTQARLINAPDITSFDSIVFEPEKVKMGDLFIGREPEKIKAALARGAYAILSDEKIPIYDEEVAWLRCENIENALISLLRYYLMQKELEFVCFDPVSLALMQKIAYKEHLVFLSENIETNFHKIMDAKPHSIVLGSDKNFIQKIYPSYTIITPQEMQKIVTFKTTLFQSSFYYNDQLYEHIKLPELFLPNLEKILDFMDEKSLPYDINKCEYTPYFYPLFVTKRMELKSFGSTSTTLIVTKENKILEDIVHYMQQKASWAKQICFLPKAHKSPKCNELEVIPYQKLSEITKLKEIEFNFAIIEADLKEIVQTIKKITKKEHMSLF